VVWTDAAVENLESIVAYVACFNEAAAVRLAERLLDLGESLAEFSERGRDIGGGRREMTIVLPYVLRYRVDGDHVTILRLRHGARKPDDRSSS
jgi:plasmid stabilization system protein ParE